MRRGSGLYVPCIAACVLAAGCTPATTDPPDPTEPWKVGEFEIAVNYGAAGSTIDPRSVAHAMDLVGSATGPTVGDAADETEMLESIRFLDAIKYVTQEVAPTASIVELGLRSEGGWPSVLGIASAQTVGIQALLSPSNQAKVSSLTLADFDLRTSPMRRVPLIPLLFDGLRLRDVPLVDGDVDAFATWCSVLLTLGDSSCASLGLTPNTTLGEAAVRGVPMRRVPMRRVPMRRVPVAGTALGRVPARTLAESSTKLATTLLSGLRTRPTLPLSEIIRPDSATLFGHEVSLEWVVSSESGPDNPFRQIPASAVPNLGCLPSCSSSTLGELEPSQIAGAVLNDLAGAIQIYPQLTVGDLVREEALLRWTPNNLWGGLPFGASLTVGNIVRALREANSSLPISDFLASMGLDQSANTGFAELFEASTPPTHANQLEPEALAMAPGSSPSALMQITVNNPGFGVVPLFVELPAQAYSAHVTYRSPITDPELGLRLSRQYSAGERVQLDPGQALTNIFLPRPLGIDEFAIRVVDQYGVAVAERTIGIGSSPRSEVYAEPNTFWPLGFETQWDADAPVWFVAKNRSETLTLRNQPTPANAQVSQVLAATPLDPSENVSLEVGCGTAAATSPASSKGSIVLDIEQRRTGSAAGSGEACVWTNSDEGATGGTETVVIPRVTGLGGNPLAGDARVIRSTTSGRGVLVMSSRDTFVGESMALCAGRVGGVPGPKDPAFPALASLPPGITRLMVTDTTRMNVFNSNPNARLRQFVQDHPDTAVLDLASISLPTRPVCGNASFQYSEAVRGRIESLVLASDRALREVILVGPSDVVAPGYVYDPTALGNEQDYSAELRSGETSIETAASGDAAQGLIPTDDVYGAINLGAAGGVVPTQGWATPLYLPTVSVSRLVDSPTDIIAQLDEFDARSGRIVGTRGSVAAYDFLEDSAVAVGAKLTGQGRTVDATLATGAWTSSQLLANWFPSSGPTATIKYLGAHFDHRRMLTGSGNVGAYVAVGAYGYGDTERVAFSERLAELFAQEISRTETVGDALRRAKSLYVAERGVLSAYDYKVLASMALYGMSSYRVQNADGSLPTEQPAIPRVAGLTPSSAISSTIVAEREGLSSSAFAASPTFDSPTVGVRGRYYSTAGGVTTNDRQPVLPLATMSAGRTGVKARGVVIESVTVNATEPSFDGWFIGAALSDSTSQAEPVTPGSFPPRLAQISDTPLGERITITPARYTSAGLATGELQRFGQLSGRVFYSNTDSADGVAPTVGDGAPSGTNSYAVRAFDASGIHQVVVLYRTATSGWASLTAAAGADQRWTATFPTASATNPASGFVQVVDRAGNVTTLPFSM